MITCALTCVRSLDESALHASQSALSGPLGSAVIPTVVACVFALVVFAFVVAIALGDE